MGTAVVDDLECEGSTRGREWAAFLRTDPSEPGEFYLAIRALMAARREDEATEVAARAVSLYPEDVVLRAALTWVSAFRRGRVKKVELVAAASALEAKETGFTRSALTRLLLIRGRRSDTGAIREPSDAAGSDPQHPFELETEAVVDLVRRRPDAAAARVEKIRALGFPATYTQAHTMMASSIASGDAQRARSWYLERQRIAGAPAHEWALGVWRIRWVLIAPWVLAWILSITTGWLWIALLATALILPPMLLANHILAAPAVRWLGYKTLAALWLGFGVGLYVRFIIGLM